MTIEVAAASTGGQERHYARALLDYCNTHGEMALYEASLISEEFIRQGLAPDEIVALHFEALQSLLNSGALHAMDRVRVMADAHQFLLEVMIVYGAKYKEFLDLQLQEAIRTADFRLQHERQRAEEAERSQMEKLDILAGIAHELNTPITIAKGNVAIADRLLNAGSVMDVPPLLGEASTALDRLSYLTGQLVSASQDEEPVVELEPHNLLEAATRALKWAQAAAEQRSLLLEGNLPGEKVFVNGNPDALLTVFGNLLSNAIRYTPAGGRVSVRCYSENGFGVFEVRDTGIGMDEEVQKRIFEKFYRAPESRKMASGGLGMGLVIAQRLVTAHGGTIELESKPGQGTQFRVKIPLWEA